MKWLAATNLLADSNGVLELVSWLRDHLQPADEHRFSALAVVREGDYFTAPSHTLELISERLEVSLTRLIEGTSARGAFGEIDVRTAPSVAVELTEEARRNDAVLLIGRAAPRENNRLVRLGAVARRSIRRLTTPVVVTPPDWTAADAGRGPVLVAVDATAPSLGALRFAEQLASSLQRPHVAAHALLGLEGLGTSYLAPAEAMALRGRHKDAESQRLVDFLEQHGYGQLPLRSVSGPTINVLLDVAAEVDAVAIVCGSRRLSLGERLFSASVGSELAALAPLPVAIVPPDLGPLDS